jgi:hypothetical protein
MKDSLALNILILVLAATWFNAKWGWNRVRIDIREFSTLTTADGKRVDQAELKPLRSAEFDELERINIPTLGLTFAEGDIGLVGTTAMIVVMIWLLLSMIGQAHTLANILYPLAATEAESQARRAWTHDTYAERRKRVVAIADALPHQFAFVGSMNQSFSTRYFICTCCTSFVVVLLIVLFEIYINFFHGYFATGYGISIWEELTGKNQPQILHRWASRLVWVSLAQFLAILALILLTYRTCKESIWMAAILERPYDAEHVRIHLKARDYF